MLKKCSDCKNYKEISKFYKNKSSKDGLFAYCKSCSDKRSAKFQKKYYLKRKDKLKIYQSRYRSKLKLDNPLYWKQKSSVLNLKYRKKAILGYGGKCNCCGEDKYEFLVIDHVNNDGKEDRKNKNSQQIVLFAIKNNFPDKYQVLCHNCNMAKAFHGYCPHKIM